MKKTFTRFALAMGAMLMGMGAYANEFYISATGSDDNDGRTAETAVKTLTRLCEVIDAQASDVYVIGMIHMDNEPKIEVSGSLEDKNYTGTFRYKTYREQNYAFDNGFIFKGTDTNVAHLHFKGVGEGAGFDGDNKWRIFYFHECGTWTFENLTFQNALAPREGGCFVVHNCTITFNNCKFDYLHCYNTVAEGNQVGSDTCDAKDENGNRVVISSVHLNDDPAAERGGGFRFQYGTLNFNDCVFSHCLARFGGAIMQTGGTLNIDRCLFVDNGKNPEDPDLLYKRTQGGALCLWTLHDPSTTNIKNTAFIGNRAYNWGGAIMLRNNVNDNLDRRVDCTIENSYFFGNECVWENGGAIGVANQDGDLDNKHFALKLFNTVMTGNIASWQGPAICWQGGTPNCLFELNNCTITRNYLTGYRGRQYEKGGAIVFADNGTYLASNVQKNIYNTVIEGNTIQEWNGTGITVNDITFPNRPLGNLDIRNSYIGNFFIGGTRPDYLQLSSEKRNFEDAENNITIADSYVHYVENRNPDEFTSNVIADASYLSGLTYNGMPWGVAPVIVSDDNMANAALQDRTAGFEFTGTYKDQTKTWTDKGYHAGNTDIIGQPRAAANNVIGASLATPEALAELVDKYDGNLNHYATALETSSVETIAVEPTTKVRFNGTEVVAEGAQIRVYNVAGMQVAHGVSTVNVANLASGIYVVSADNAVLKIAK